MEKRNNKNGKRMTVDELAIITNNQFNRVDERFDQMDVRFDKMDHTLKNILDVVLEIPSKKAFERLENKVQTMDLRLTSVERKVK
ncbi:MAG: hypothetical protein G01um101444_330 [Parcubacteria group bacterium Gr01-1014_44]|nr:MAG: hypothetical protein G01um101444_330 [Parcubacteria group bacterium Gr01-1014_44]